MRPRFLADADLKWAIVAGVRRREPSIDFLSAHEANLTRMPDPEVLRLAAREQRILVSHDLDTMPRHFWEFVSAQKSPGVFLISQDKPIAVAVDALVEIWALSEAEEWQDQLRYVPL